MPKIWRRRAIIGAGILAWLGFWRYWPNRPGEITLTAHPHVAGFRVLQQAEGGAAAISSPSSAAFLGIGPGPEPLPDDIVERVADDPEAALYGDRAGPRLAYFTDIRCPICRPFEEELDALAEENPALSRVTHELPIFGATSELAARAIIAAGPNLAPQLRQRLQRTAIALTEASLTAVIESLGENPEPVLAGLYDSVTERQLQQSRAVADLLGLYGTPATVIGRTVILGAPPLWTLRAVLRAEFLA